MNSWDNCSTLRCRRSPHRVYGERRQHATSGGLRVWVELHVVDDKVADATVEVIPRSVGMIVATSPRVGPNGQVLGVEANALGELPPEQRSVVHLKLWEGLTFEKIAATLEIPQNTAASRYRYGLDKLRERLRPLYDEIK